MKVHRPWLPTVVLLIAAGCNSGHGPDSLFSRQTSSAQQATDCLRCHASAMGTRRPVMGANGDFGANSAQKSHHISGGSDPLADQCLVCHEMSNHMGGTVRLKNADTGAVIAYSSTTATATRESFCLSCHDTDGATATFRTGGTPSAPFIDGSVMGQIPYRASAEIYTNWTKTYGHKQKGLTCLGDGTMNTGCHGNGHGTAYVGLLARNLTLPNTKTSFFSTADELDYDLCFSCHASYGRVTKEAVLGVKAGGNYDMVLSLWWGFTPPYYIPAIQTLFRDVSLESYPGSGKIYDDAAGFFPYQNLHLGHVQAGPVGAWKYRGSIDSSVGCLACHSVHGSNTQWGWVHDEMIFSHYTGSVGDQYSMLGSAATITYYPMSCAINCHDPDIAGITHGWFEPSQE